MIFVLTYICWGFLGYIPPAHIAAMYFGINNHLVDFFFSKDKEKLMVDDINHDPDDDVNASTSSSVNEADDIEMTKRANEKARSRASGEEKDSDSGRGSSLSAVLDENSPVADLLPTDFKERCEQGQTPRPTSGVSHSRSRPTTAKSTVQNLPEAEM